VRYAREAAPEGTMTIGSKTIDVELNHDELVALLGLLLARASAVSPNA
jgi:hypothetical protein